MKKISVIGIILFLFTFSTIWTYALPSSSSISSTYDSVIEFYGGKYKYVKMIKCYGRTGYYEGNAKLYKRISGQNSEYIIVDAPNGYSYEIFPTEYSPNNNAYNYRTGAGPYYVKV